jgi:glucose/arabinose dehydrogenase
MRGSYITITIVATMAFLVPSAGGSASAIEPRSITIQSEGAQARTITGKLKVPWALDFLPNGNIIFTERSGNIKVKRAGRVRHRLLKRIDQVAVEGEGGLLGLALHPNYASNNFVYVYYTYREGGQLFNRVVRYRRQGKTLVAPRIILDRIPGAATHNGGRIKFGPDGLLYITTGDSQQPNLAQDVNSLAGKILRIRANGRIPPGNPFGASPVYSLGHRNPQGLAWDRKGRLWATEHGSIGNDEVNRILPGRNYGWPLIQGDQNAPGLRPPVLHSGSSTWAPSGAAFVSGSVFFTGLRGETLFRFRPRNLRPPRRFLAGRFGRLRDVVVGPDGFLYIITNNRDGRGTPSPADDRIIRIDPAALR